jgi:hypothetical protein
LTNFKKYVIINKKSGNVPSSWGRSPHTPF